jgi:menaquinone-dependent protoporphyrinogen oxidase
MPGVLVAYATKHGSTREVAEAVSKTLRAEGVQAGLRPARGVRGPIGDRDLVVLGAPVCSGRWHGDAHRFLKRHRKELLTVPAAVFGMGPRNPGQEAWQRSRRQLDRALAKRDWLRPAAVAVFGGADSPTRHGKQRRDLRDWDAVRARATGIGHDQAQPPPGTGAAAGS